MRGPKEDKYVEAGKELDECLDTIFELADKAKERMKEAK